MKRREHRLAANEPSSSAGSSRTGQDNIPRAPRGCCLLLPQPGASRGGGRSMASLPRGVALPASQGRPQRGRSGRPDMRGDVRRLVFASQVRTRGERQLTV